MIKAIMVKGFAEFAKKFIEESGKAEVVLFEGVTPGAVDYSAIVQKVKKSGAEAVMFGGYHPEASKIITMMKKKRLDTTFISDDGVKDITFIKVAGEIAEGAYASGPMDTSTNPLSKAAVAAHKAEFDSDPGCFLRECLFGGSGHGQCREGCWFDRSRGSEKSAADRKSRYPGGIHFL